MRASQGSGIEKTPGALVIAAHPDDETIGAGILMSQTPGVQIVHVTEGSPPNLSDARASGFSTRQAYAKARRTEAVKALAKAGIREDAITNLCFVDQQVSFHMEDLAFRIVELIEETKPKILLTHAYEGGHPDHDAVAFACHLAYQLQYKQRGKCVFDLLEFTGYHAENGRMKICEFLPYRGQEQYRFCLTPEERQLKIDMLTAFESQSKTLQHFLSPQSETFRRAPIYDFSRAPHDGKLFYEHFDWGINGQTWRRLSCEALNRVDRGRLGS